jgi:glutamate-1-semialdehyde 2,1-aminomutase
MNESRYLNSEKLLRRALKVIPLGSQTFSKSITQYPLGVSPLYITRGVGSRVWDVDGNQYIDFVNGLASVLLGYGDKDVTQAVQKQIEGGVNFSLPHPIEVDVAEKLVEIIPCAEMVRFGKNGTDATSASIRLSRAYTNRDHVAICGYHGWQDWSIGITSMNSGVPKSVQDLSHTFFYNDINSLKSIFQKYPDQIAAVILEPMNTVYPENEFLKEVRDITNFHNSILIFDETITGGRYSIGGAQDLFDVTPDLATFGKGIANGFPLSAIVGKRKIMRHMENIFFSGTFSGETSALAAAKVVLDKIQNTSLLIDLESKGKRLIQDVKMLINKHRVEHIFSISGHPSWSFLHIKGVKSVNPMSIKTLMLQELFARGIIFIGTHNLSAAHSEEDLKQLILAYDIIFPMVREAVESNTINDYLRVEPITPLFQVRNK